MSSTSPSTWYVAFAIGTACIFAVVVAVAVVIQLVRRVGVQLAAVTRTLGVIHANTAAVPALAGITADAGEMNEILAGVREDLHHLVRGAVP